MSTKVFVGNLAFRTTDQALTEAFSKYGEVKSGVIITRGRRSLGYGFVEFANPEQAATAVEKMKGAEIAGRQIKVELAKDISEQDYEEQGGQNEGDGPARRRRRAPQDNAGSTSTNASSSNASTANTANSGNTGNTDNDNNDRPRKPRKKRAPRGGNNSGGNNTSDNTASSTSTNTTPAEKPARAPRPPREPREKIPSKTTLFVANLPFSVTDAELLSVFAGTKAKAAHVALTRNGRSRGYGFVEFENEADQQEALKSHQGKPIEGTNGTRNLSLTISHSVPNPPAASAPVAPAPATN